MTTADRRRALASSGLVHSNPESVSAALFVAGEEFFLAEDKVQVKYEMLRAHVVDGMSVVAAAGAHGYSRAAFYLVEESFARAGMAGLVDERRGRKGPLKMTAEVAEFIAGADPTTSGSELADAVAQRFGVVLHRRTIERARRR